MTYVLELVPFLSITGISIIWELHDILTNIRPQFLFGNALSEGLYGYLPTGTLFIENSK